MKQHFAINGLPDTVQTDDSQFYSAKFRHFANRYKFEHVTSLPNYATSNEEENTVWTIKRLMKTAREDQTDPCLAIFLIEK